MRFSFCWILCQPLCRVISAYILLAGGRQQQTLMTKYLKVKPLRKNVLKNNKTKLLRAQNRVLSHYCHCVCTDVVSCFFLPISLYSSPFLIIVFIASYSIYFNLYTGKIWFDLKMWKGANFISYYKSWFLTAISLQGSIVVLTYSVFNISNWYEVILDNFF